MKEWMGGVGCDEDDDDGEHTQNAVISGVFRTGFHRGGVESASTVSFTAAEVVRDSSTMQRCWIM